MRLVGIQGGCTRRYMLGDMDDVVGEEAKSIEWTPVGNFAGDGSRGEMPVSRCSLPL